MRLFLEYLKKGVFLLILVAGLLLILNCVSYGENSMSQIMRQHGGGMDTNVYLIYLQKSIDKYKTLGTVLAAVGGLGLLIDMLIPINKKNA
jgi:hypothetical protein